VLDGFSGHGSFCPPCYDDAASFYREMAAEDVGVFDDDEAV
jgi:hypothetical protein